MSARLLFFKGRLDRTEALMCFSPNLSSISSRRGSDALRAYTHIRQ